MNRSQPGIFVSIASYSDPELPRTLDSCLANARHPENLRFGICWQHDIDVPIDLTRFKADSRFRFREYTIQESKGGSWARNLAQQLYDGETFVLQVDSHMVFAPGWDASLVWMMHDLPADKPLISMIPPLFRAHDDGRLERRTDCGIRASRIADWQEGSGWAPWFDWGLTDGGRQRRNRFLSGSFVFAAGGWCVEVQQDPDHYYWGEEFALTLRSYTWGYDIFLPDSIVVWHMEHLNGPPRRHWEHGPDVVAERNGKAIDRLRMLAYSDEPADHAALGRYDLGPRRSLAEYERFAGIDLKGKRAHRDVFAGTSPNPLTIRTTDDWAVCMTIEDFEEAATA